MTQLFLDRRRVLPVRNRVLAALAAAVLCSLGVRPALADDLWLGTREPRPRSAGTVRIATYNLLNLFDGVDDPALSGEEEDMDDAKPENQLRAVADTIRRMDADVIGLEEIESFDALNAFRATHLKGLGYDHIISIDVGAERGIEQAVLSRFPIREACVWPQIPLGGVHPELWNGRPNRYAGQPLECRRSPLRVVIEVPGAAAAAEGEAPKPYEITLFIVHQKSGRGNEYWREAESRAFLKMIDDLQKADAQRNIAVLGDFNAMPQDTSVQMYHQAGMTDVLGERPKDDKTKITHESGRGIDGILVNAAMAREVVADSAMVLATPLRAEGADWQTTPTPTGYASDHLPVMVDLHIGDK